jgi:dTDP-4-dehydrorhamnose reductase
LRVTVLGANGQLGRELVRAFREHEVRALDRAACEVTDPASVRRALSAAEPELVLNPVAYTNVDRAELEPDAATAVNATGAGTVARVAAELGAGIVYVSTDYVFDGAGGAPYSESATTNPLNVYGRSKLEGERETARLAARAWIVRTSWIFGGEGKSFVNSILAAASQRDELAVVDDEVAGPTLARDLAEAILELVVRAEPGLYHLANGGECSRAELARAVLDLTGSSTRIRPVPSPEYWGDQPHAVRPGHSTLANTAAAARGVRLRPWRDALADHLCAPR